MPAVFSVRTYQTLLLLFLTSLVGWNIHRLDEWGIEGFRLYLTQAIMQTTLWDFAWVLAFVAWVIHHDAKKHQLTYWWVLPTFPFMPTIGILGYLIHRQTVLSRREKQIQLVQGQKHKTHDAALPVVIPQVEAAQTQQRPAPSTQQTTQTQQIQRAWRAVERAKNDVWSNDAHQSVIEIQKIISAIDIATNDTEKMDQWIKTITGQRAEEAAMQFPALSILLDAYLLDLVKNPQISQEVYQNLDDRYFSSFLQNPILPLLLLESPQFFDTCTSTQKAAILADPAGAPWAESIYGKWMPWHIDENDAKTHPDAFLDLIKNGNPPTQRLKYAHEAEIIFVQALGNPRCSSAQIMSLWRALERRTPYKDQATASQVLSFFQGDIHVWISFAMNPSTPIAILQKIFSACVQDLPVEKHKNNKNKYQTKTINNVIDADMNNSGAILVRTLAENPSLPSWMLHEIAQCMSPSINIVVAANPNTAKETIQFLYDTQNDPEHEDENVSLYKKKVHLDQNMQQYVRRQMHKYTQSIVVPLPHYQSMSSYYYYGTAEPMRISVLSRQKSMRYPTVLDALCDRSCDGSEESV